MSLLKVEIDTSNIGTSSELDRLSLTEKNESLEAVGHLLQALQLGTKNTARNVTVNIKNVPVAAHGHITFSGEVSVDDAVVVNGVTFTAKVSPTTEFLFQANADAGVAGASFVSKFNASTSAKLTSITASNVSGAITLTADDPGLSGNGFKIVKTTGTNVAVTDFAGGTDGTLYNHVF